MMTRERFATWLVTVRTPVAWISTISISMPPPKTTSAAGITCARCCRTGSASMQAASCESTPPMADAAEGAGVDWANEWRAWESVRQ